MSISPPTSNIASGPLSVSIAWCATGATLDPSQRWITFNGQQVNFSWNPGSQSGCDDYATSSGMVTLGPGANTFSASVSAYYEPPPPPPECPPICDQRPQPPLWELSARGPRNIDPFFPAAVAEVSPATTEWVSGGSSATWSTLAPVVSLAPHSSGILAGSFDVVFGHSTPAYFSLGQARALTLAYNSSTVNPTPVIFLDVSNPPGSSPTAYSIQLRRASNNSLLTLLNGSQTVYYAPSTGIPVRLAVALDAQSNGLATGVLDVTVTVTAHLASGNQSTVVPTRVLAVDQTTGSFGKGFDVAGIQRVRALPGTYSVLLTEGDGSAVFFQSAGECPTCGFVSPAGETSSLSKLTDPNLGSIYRRRYLDGSVLDFTSNGRMARSFGNFGDTSQFIWTDTLLTQIRDPMGKLIALAYVSGKLQSVTDPAGRVTSYAIDGSGRLYRITDPDSLATNLTYDGNNFLSTVTDRAGAVTSFTYDALRRMDTTYAPTMQIFTGASVRPRAIVRAPERTVWQPDRAGTDTATKKLAIRSDTLYAFLIGPRNDTIKAALDRFGAPTKLVGPYGEATTVTRDSLGRALVMTEPNGHATRWSYMNGFTSCGYLICQSKDSTTGRTITYEYGSNASVTRITGDVTRLDVVYHTGSRGPAGAVDSVLGANRALIYSTHLPDALGRDTVVRDGAQHVTRIQHDSTWGNVRQVTNPQGSVFRVHYDPAGRVDSAWIPASGLYTYQYDPLNRMTQVKNPLGYVTRYVYGATTLDRVIDPKGQIYKFTYNPLGLLVARHDLADTTKADTLKYDESGNTRTVRTRRGDVITITYDLAGRALSRSGPDFPVDSFKYDPAGRWMVAWNANQRDSSAFDQAGRLATTRQAMLGGVTYQLTYTYDIRDRLINRSAPNGGNLTRHVYNASTGVLDTLCAASACVAFRHNSELLTDRRTYNPGLGGNWFQERVFNSSHSASSDSFSIASLDASFGTFWHYDSLERARSEEFPGHGLLPPSMSVYSYDPAGRIANRCALTQGICFNEYGSEGLAYSYDLAGNRTDSAANAAIGPGNRTQTFKGYTISYDANGNALSKTGPGASYTYTWDALGRLVEVRNGGGLIATYSYDALGRRVSGTAADGTFERYVYDGDHVILDVNGAHALKVEYGYEPGADRLFAIKNSQGAAWTGVAIADPKIGTIRGIANLSGGAIRKQYWTTVWGDAESDTGVVTRFRMAGREYDQMTKLYYMRARYYDPEVGRFLSEDPIGIAGGLNLYAYANNDPVNRRDPFGLCDDLQDLKKEGQGNKGEPMVASDCVGGDDGGDGRVLIWNDGLVTGEGTESGGGGRPKPPPVPVWDWPNSVRAWLRTDMGQQLTAILCAWGCVGMTEEAQRDIDEATTNYPMLILTTRGPVAGKIAGYNHDGTFHGLTQAIGRDGHGVAPKAILDAVRNPVTTARQGGGRVFYGGRSAAVILNQFGQIVTTWARNRLGWRF